MEQLLLTRLDNRKTREENIHLLREALQLVILKILNEIKGFQYIAFVGGTSLRFLYSLQRFSEDLGFSVTRPKDYNFNKILTGLQFQLEKMNFHVEFKIKEQKVVQSIMVKFIDILQKMNLTTMKDQKLFIRIEIDSNPPVGWKCEMRVINNIFIFPVWHFDLSSLFATKLHACFFRKYKKGRDYYDLMWYLTKKIVPNFKLFNNAIIQTERVNYHLDKNNFESFVLDRLSDINFSQLRKDVSPFLISQSEKDLINKDVFNKMVKDFCQFLTDSDQDE
jgi:predicted nucleotidyltransferase component of viral defense system